MGNNTLTTITGGIGRKEQVNQYKDALVGDILPRNTDGEVEALAGNVGTDAVPFNLGSYENIVVKKILLREEYSFSNIKPKELLYTAPSALILETGVYFAKLFGSGASGGTGYGGGGGGYCECMFSVDGSDSVSVSCGAAGESAFLTINGVQLAIAYGGSTSSGGEFDVRVSDSKIIRAFGGNGGNGATVERPGASGTSFYTSSGGTYGGGGGGRGDGGVGYQPYAIYGGGGGGYFAGGAHGNQVGGVGGAGACVITRVL